MLKMTNQSGTVVPDGGSSSSYINGPMSKSQTGGVGFTFPTGKDMRYGKITLLNPQSGIWESEYYNSPYPVPLVTGTLWQASSTEYWRITSPENGKTATVRLRWDSQSDIRPVTTSGGINDIRVAEYIGSAWAEKTSATPVGNDTDGTVQTSASIAINNTGDPRFYTLGSVSLVKPTIILSATPDICSGAITGYLPYSLTSGDPDQYTIDFDEAANTAGFTDVASWTALPASPILIAVAPGTANGTYNATITVRTSSPVNTSVPYPFTLTIISDMTWTGAVSTDWNTAGNWSCGILPGLNNSVIIPDLANEPILAAGLTGAVNNLTIAAGSSLTITGNTLQIAGAISNSGIFTAASGSIEMRGSVAQTIGANVFAGNIIKDLTVNNAAGLSLLGSLTVTGIVTAQNGDLSSGGFLTLASTAAGTGLINGAGSGSVTGNVTMQRYLSSGFGYKYFSSPFQAATVNEFGDDMDLLATFPSFYRYDESRSSAGWVNYTNPSGILSPLHGYAVNFGPGVAPITVDVTGTVNNGYISRTMFNNNNTYTRGFNLAGNPYPSPINWQAASGWTKTNIDNALYYFKAGGADEYSGTYSTFIGGVSSDGLATGIIPSMQAFFVHVTNGIWPVTGTLATDNDVRVTDMTHSFVKSDGTSSIPLLRLTAGFTDDSSSIDPVVIYFNEKATPDFDVYLDALKLMNTDPFTPNIYCIIPDGNNLSINSLPSSEENPLFIPLGLKLSRKGTLSFNLRDKNNLPPETIAYLYDAKTKKNHKLDQVSGYNISLAEGEYNDRFFLRLDQNIKDITGNNGTSMLNVYSLKGKLIADIYHLSGKRGSLLITNISGQVISKNEIYNTGYHEFRTSLGTGIYIVTFITGNFRETKKILIF
jgi:hypothetical protein